MNDLIKALTAEPAKLTPDVWISRIVLYDRLTPEPVQIRDIPLSKGLNIVWAEEAEEDDPAAEITGHSAGKTTFCRLIRYVLGEKTYGSKASMALIRKAFPNGYVAAELHVSGRQWAVRRPIGSGRLSYILPDSNIESLLQEQGQSVSQDDYLNVVGFEGLLDSLGSGGIVTTGEPIQWGHILSWCTRDQEARFQSVHEWRSPRSESETPGFRFPKHGPLFVIRTVLGLFSPRELNGEENLSKLQRKKEPLLKELEDKKREPIFRVNLYDQELRKVLSEIFPTITDIYSRPFTSTDLLVDDLGRLVQKAKKQLEGKAKAFDSSVKKQQKIVDDYGADIQQCEREKEGLEALLEMAEKSVEEISSGGTEHSKQLVKIKQAWNKQCLHGSVLISECQHVRERQKILQFKDTFDQRALKELEDQREKEVLQLKKDLELLSSRGNGLNKDRQQVIDKRDALRVELNEVQKQLKDLTDASDALVRWQKKLDKPEIGDEVTSLQEKLDKMDGKILSIEVELASLLTKHNKNREYLTKIFSAAVRSVLTSGTYDGEVRFDGRELDFCITHGQAMTGEAVETLAVLLADISCNLYNIQEETSLLPGFLLHDSPREADLGKRLYYSFIRFVAKVEERFGQDNCPFQYILTTTTAPPKELQTEKNVKLQLNAAERSELLFRNDFMDFSKQLSLLELQE